MKTKIKTEQEIKAMRQSGLILEKVLTELQKQAQAGVTTKYLDEIAIKLTKKSSAQPAFLGYQGFPAGLCVSVNDEIVHGIPSVRKLQAGDIVGLDYGVKFDGMITDSAVTILIGDVPITAQQKRLLNGTEVALNEAISIIKEGVSTKQIGQTIGRTLHKFNLKPILNLSGHGVGHHVHEDPSIPNYDISNQGQILRSGHTIAIEPIASLSTQDMYLADDDWTCKTADGSLSAQFEHTILVTTTGCEVLTKSSN